MTSDAGLRGVFNVAGPPPIPLSLLCHATGRQAVPVPELILPYVLGRFGFPKLPAGAIAHLKHPIVVDDSAFVDATGFENEFDEVQIMSAFRMLETS